MEFKKSIVLDIDMDMVFMEHILLNHVNLPEGALYVKGMRYPITDRVNINEYKKLGILSTTPYHPIVAVDLVKVILEIVAIDNNPYRDLLYNNPLSPTGVIYHFYDKYNIDTINDLVPMLYPGISLDDYNNIIQYVKIIYDKLTHIVEQNPSRIYSIDAEDSRIKILVGDDIAVFRYHEAIENKSINAVSHG